MVVVGAGFEVGVKGRDGMEVPGFGHCGFYGLVGDS